VIRRRDALKLLTAAPAAAAFTWTGAEVVAASEQAAAARRPGAGTPAFRPKFFTAGEWATVRVLVDLILPGDDRSGSATEAGVPEFMDFMMTDQPARQTAMRGGLAWINREMRRRTGRAFADSPGDAQRALLDDLSWPQRVRAEMRAGAAFYASFRDLTASGFFTSKIGMADLGYMGNVYVSRWTGCPEAVLRKLGLDPSAG
jgi:hypothetical protein